LREYFHRFDYVIAALLVFGAIAYIWFHLNHRNNSNSTQA